MKLLKCLSGMLEKLQQNDINPNLKHGTTWKHGKAGGEGPDRNLLHKVTPRVNFKKKGQTGKEDMLLKKPPDTHPGHRSLLYLKQKKYF